MFKIRLLCIAAAMAGTGCMMMSEPEEAAGSSQMALTGTVDEGEQVVALNTNTNEAWIAEADEDGHFALEVDEGEYAVVILDEDFEANAVVADGSSTTVVVDGATDLGEIVVDEEANVATAETLDAPEGLELADLDTVETVDGETRDIELDTILVDDMDDEDADGVADFFDNDSNENGIFDNNEAESLSIVRADFITDELPTIREAVRDLRGRVFDNLKINGTLLFAGDGDVQPFTNHHVMTFEIKVPAPLLAYIASVEVVGMPGYADGTIAPAAGGFTLPGYPVAGTTWSSNAYGLVQGTHADGDDVYTVWIEPVVDVDPHPAMFVYRITLNTGSVVHLFARLFYVFHTPPKVETTDDGLYANTLTYPLNAGDLGTSSNPILMDGAAATLTVEASRPLSRAGGFPICGMSFQAHIFYLDSTGNQMNAPAVITTRVADRAPCLPGTTLSLPISTTDLPTTYGGAPVASYKIDFTSVGANGDNSAFFLYAAYL